MKVLISIDTGHMAETVLQEAKTFLKGFPDAEVYVFTVIDITLVAVGHDTDETVMMEAMQQYANELIDVANRILGDKTFVFSSKVGYPVEEILEKADEIKCDLLILGTHGRTGLNHFLIGSVAEKALRLSKCNTLVIPIKEKQQ